MERQPEAVESFVQGVAKQSWEQFMRDPMAYLLAGLLVALVSALSLGLLMAPLFVGFIEMTERGSRGESLSAGQVFSGFSKFVPSFVATLLVSIAMIIGFTFLVLPGLCVVLFTCFTLPAIALDGLGPVEAIKRSFDLVRSNLVNVLVLLIVNAILQGVGGAVVLGVLLTAPLSLIGFTVAYQRLRESAGQAPAQQAA